MTTLTFPQVLTDPRQVRAYVLAGNSTFTLKSKSTEKHFTFRVRKPVDENGRIPPVRFVALMNGPDNENSYSFLGTIFTENGNTYKHGRKSRVGADSMSAKAFVWFWENVTVGDRVPASIEVMRSNTCCRCGRQLTNPASIASGIGPECSGRVS